MKVIAIIQARTSSSRLPGKVLEDVGGDPMVVYQLKRLKRCRSLDQICLATSNDPSDDTLSRLVSNAGFFVFRGDLHDVLDRFYMCAKQQDANIVVRLTGDCPLTDPELVDEIVDAFVAQDLDYLANSVDDSSLSVPDGFDIEVFSTHALKLAFTSAKLQSQREHVTPWLRTKDANIKWSNFCHEPSRPYYRVTVDDQTDLSLVRNIVNALSPTNPCFGVDDVVQYLKENPAMANSNISTQRNEGYLKSLSDDRAAFDAISSISPVGTQLWNRAKRLIPGGNMLLSKRPEMYLPNNWPSYFKKSKGCKVWDIDGRELIDMSIMGIGTNILGYGHPEVDEVVASVVQDGNMSTLNCPEEVWLAERLVELHPWSDMVRFARSGGEANAIAVRIARAATGRDAIAICGYHGWHDWYLASNLQNQSRLEEHLLPGLEPNGVPKGLAGTIHPFSYNRIDQLQQIISNYDLAAVKMEVQRSTPPDPGFLEKVRSLCSSKGIVLIFDECTSGFRESLGGLHLKYGVNPDMAMFGKALGNGYAITATVGTRAVMEAAQSTFISSTFWTERIGPSAALKTLEIMEREQSWDFITSAGLSLRAGWQSLADKYQLEIIHYGLPSLCGFSFKSSSSLAYKTLISQEMLKLGYLAGTSCYTCMSHTPQVISDFIVALDPVFSMISECESGRSIQDLLDGPICHSGFKRLN